MNGLSDIYSAAIYIAERDKDESLRAENIEAFGGTHVWVISVSRSTLRRFAAPSVKIAGGIILRQGPMGRDIAVLQLQTAGLQLRSLVGFDNPTFTELLAQCERSGEVAIRLMCEKNEAMAFLRCKLDHDSVMVLRNHTPNPPFAPMFGTLEMASVASVAGKLKAFKFLSLLPENRVTRVEVSVAFLGDNLFNAGKSAKEDKETIAAPPSSIRSSSTTLH